IRALQRARSTRGAVGSGQSGDYLARTLPACLRILPKGSLTVVTNARDIETQAVARECGANLRITDAWTRHDDTWRLPEHWSGLWRERGRRDNRPILNKALALDEAFGFAGSVTPPPHRYDV